MQLTFKTNIFFILLLSYTTLIIGIINGYISNYPFFSLFLFTRQNVLLINIYFFAMFFKLNKILLEKISFVCLINSFFIFFYIFIIDLKGGVQEGNKTLQPLTTILEHYILPLIFIYYYFFINKITLKYRQFYIALIHPFIYCIGILILQKYPYKFLDPTKNNFSLKIKILTFLIILISLLTIYIKNKILKNQTNKLQP